MTKHPLARSVGARPGWRALAVAALAAAGLLAGCGPLRVPDAPPVAAPSAPATPQLPPMASRVAQAGPAPQASGRPHVVSGRRNIQLAGRCNQVDVDGFGENVILDVRDSTVVALNWTIRVGRKGSCSFPGGDFYQVRSRPHIELRSRDGSGCKLMIWQDPRRITLGHTGCERWCQPASIADEAFPAMFDPRTGGCAPIG